MTKNGIIIGGGIAGLTTALALQRRGIGVQVYEAAAELLPVGAGIWMAPNAMQVFDRLGIAARINEGGVPLQKIEVTDKYLRPVLRTNQANILKRFGYTTTAIRRSRLQQILLEEIGRSCVILAKTCTGIRDDGNDVRVDFQDGTSAAAGFVIAADGIHSPIRRTLFPDTVLSATGHVVWRGISDISLAPACKKAIIEVWHNGLRFGFSEVGDNEVDWFAVEKGIADESDAGGIRDRLCKAFKGFSYPVPDILGASGQQKIIRNAIRDFDPLRLWHRGRVCLAGDAAHAATPYMGQGGCQAVEDAWVIADCLSKESSVEDAFACFQRIRRPKAVHIVHTSRMMGRIGYLSGAAAHIRDFLIRATPLAITERQFNNVYSLNY